MQCTQALKRDSDLEQPSAVSGENEDASHIWRKRPSSFRLHSLRKAIATRDTKKLQSAHGLQSMMVSSTDVAA